MLHQACAGGLGALNLIIDFIRKNVTGHKSLLKELSNQKTRQGYLPSARWGAPNGHKINKIIRGLKGLVKTGCKETSTSPARLFAQQKKSHKKGGAEQVDTRRCWENDSETDRGMNKSASSLQARIFSQKKNPNHEKPSEQGWTTAISRRSRGPKKGQRGVTYDNLGRGI